MSKKAVLGFLKWFFALGILFLLFRSGKLPLQDLHKFLANPRAAALCFAITGFVYLCAFFRWQTLLQSQGIILSYWATLRLGMLGQFFSALIPGTVGGDLVKAVYVARRFPQQKMKTVMTIFLDRLVGLAAMIVLGGAAFALGKKQIEALPPDASTQLILTLGYVLLVLALFILLSLLIFPWLAGRLPERSPAFLSKLPLKNIWINLYEVAHDFRNKVGVLYFVLLLSIAMHGLNVTFLWTVAVSVFGPAPWGMVTTPLFVIASILGLCAMSIPLAPLGLGVGQLAFAGIFAALKMPHAAFGVTVVTASQIVALCWNLCGSLFFATYRHEIEAPAEVPAC